jgi:ABC-type Zn uptake system ZnuABC Zn-binding protein ZnuA
VLLPLVVAAAISVAATTTDLRDLVAVVGGDRVRVESLTAPHHDPHAREIHPRQLQLLKAADLLVRIGLDHEAWLARAARAAGLPARDLDCSKGLALLGTETPRLRASARPHVHAFGNTHYWLDPENARPITARIAAALAEISPAGGPAFEANRARFVAALDQRLARWRAALAPFAGARAVAVHDTWPYFARRFGLEIVATLEETPGVPPSPAHLGALMERMRRTGVRLVLAEPGAPAGLLRRVTGGTGARVVVLAPSVGSEPEATGYLALFDLNVGRLARALASR